MTCLFEYDKWLPIESVPKLKTLLLDIWSNQFEEETPEGHDNHYQPFLQFDEGKIRANNYIGFLQHEDQLIEIYPKVFRQHQNPDKNLMLQHIFYWFSYCRKWRFPFNQANLDSREIEEFPELIIHLMARQFHDTVSEQPLMQYQQVEETLMSPRGSINFNRYISRGLSNGNYHLIECDHEPFLFDNKVNRVVKYCIRLLLNQTKLSNNQRVLQEALFILDEVADTPATLVIIDSIKLNAFYDDYQLVLDMCRSIISQNIYSHLSYDTSHWCMLLPMEYVFEDFVAGFMDYHFSTEWEIEYQKSDAYLVSNPEAFQMQHDIFLTHRVTKRKVIIDTKYKLRDFDDLDKKKDVSQSDMYQVVSYAFRRGCNEVILIYPNAGEQFHPSHTFEVHSGFKGADVVKVKVVEIPFWSMNSFGNVKERLKTVLGEILE
jgi:5-methylcytosine-specific restriction enzyme subunit McrC